MVDNKASYYQKSGLNSRWHYFLSPSNHLRL